MFTILGADGKEYGPVTAAHVHEWIRDGRANQDTKARLGREGPWKTLGSFPEFGGVAAPAASDTPPRVVIANRIVDQPTATLAGRELRLAGAMVDGFLKILCYLPITIPIMRAAFADAQSGEQRTIAEVFARTNQLVADNAAHTYPWLALLVAVQFCLLTWRGQSVGKLLVRTRIVVAADGSPPGFARAFLLRGSVPCVLEMIPILGVLIWLVDVCFIFGDERRCLHDLIAGTKVVRA